MKTVEEVAGEIVGLGIERTAAIIRADREAVLKRVEETATVLAHPGGMGLISFIITPDKLAAVKKEVCG